MKRAIGVAFLVVMLVSCGGKSPAVEREELENEKLRREIEEPTTTSFPGTSYGDDMNEDFTAACDGPNRVYLTKSYNGGAAIAISLNDPQCVETPQ